MEENHCQVNCVGLYADVEFVNSTHSRYKVIKDRLVLESLTKNYEAFKENHVKNQILKYFPGADLYRSKHLDYHPLQVVQIYFSTATYDDIVNDVSVTIGDQLSAIGGTMGLFTGFSILSAVEIVYFLLKSLFSFVSKVWMKGQSAKELPA